MRILVIHNKYGKHSGEETAVYAQIDLLREKGHTVFSYFRSSEELETMPLGKMKAFANALYNPKSIRALNELMEQEKPDIVHIHNLYPFISPAILPHIKKFNIPVFMTVHNYRLLCPNGLFYTHGNICEKCTGGIREWNAIINNCEGSMFKSTGYALRNYWARKAKYYTENIDAFLCLTNFQLKKLVSDGLQESKCFLLGNMYEANSEILPQQEKGKYVGYVGRISEEKGVNVLIEAARMLPEIKFKLAGNVSEGNSIVNEAPENVEFVGFMDKSGLAEFYSKSLFIVFPSVCYETFGFTLLEAMAHEKAIIASNIAGVPEIVEENNNGLLFSPGSAEELRSKIEFLAQSPGLIAKFGKNGLNKVSKKYSKDLYYNNLLKLYNQFVNDSRV